MFMDDVAIAGPELEALRCPGGNNSSWLGVIQEDAPGAPMRSPLFASSSNNIIHHAYSLLQLQLSTNSRIDALSTIVEFGGGYGSLARLIFRLGFRGTYIIFDLPEFAALQKFYLSSLDLPNHGTIHWTDSIDEVLSLAPQPDLFVALWSLSETPLALRQLMSPTVLKSRRHLIAYQDRFSGIDNPAYFQELAASISPASVHDFALPHLPGNRYFIASR